MEEVGPEALGLLDVDDVAALLKISVRQTYRLIQGGEIDSLRVGRALRCTRQAVADYIAKCADAAQAIRAAQNVA
jgi:excisionase family DNA binding protein